MISERFENMDYENKIKIVINIFMCFVVIYLKKTCNFLRQILGLSWKWTLLFRISDILKVYPSKFANDTCKLLKVYIAGTYHS